MNERVIDETRSGRGDAPSADECDVARLRALREYDLGDGRDETFDRIVRLAVDRLGCASAYVSIVDADRQWTKAACGGPPHSRPLKASFCARAIGFDDVVVVSDPAMDEGWRDLAACPENQGLGFYAAASLRTVAGHAIGTLCVWDSRPLEVDDAWRQALRDLAAITMDALELRLALRRSDQVRQRLGRSEARHRAILDTAVDAIITIGADGTIQNVNAAAEAMFGYAASSMVGRNARMLMPESDASRHDGYLKRYLSHREGGRVIGCGREVMGLRADGSTFPADLAVSETVFDDDVAFTGILRDLTDRRRVEEKLREHIELIRLAEEAARLGHWRLDVATEDLFWSEEIYRIHGVDPATFEPSVDAAAAMWRPEHRRRVMLAVETAIRERRAFEFDLTVVRPDGSERIVHSHGRVQTDEAGTVIAVVGTFQDVTKRVLIEQELKRSQERLERSTSYTNIGIWEWDIPTGHLWWSDRMAPLFGLGEGAVATRYDVFIDAVHVEDREVVKAAVRAALDGDGRYEVEHRVVWPDGKLRWMQQRAAVERDIDGTPRRMLGVVQDVTRVKEAEQALKQSERLLADSIENISDGFILIDADDRTVLWNQRLLEIYPYVAPHIQVGARFADVVRAAAGDGQYVNAADRFEDWMAERMDHHRLDEELYEEPLAGGCWVRVAERRMENGWRVGIRTDITEIRCAREEAQAANRAKSEFLSKMSHELRTPLNAILGFAQLLEASRKDPLSDTQRRHVTHILDGGRHLLDLINEVLDMARIEAGRLPLTLETLDPTSVVDDCLSMARTLATPHDITVTVRIDLGGDQNVRVIADAMRLRQVLLNLLSNAVKYNRDGGDVHLDVRPVAERLRFSVSDTGPGLSKEAQGHIFDPFDRVGAETSSVEGTGIGLTITRQLVSLMGGGMGLDSTPGQGSVFWVDLPLGDEKGETA